MALSRASSTDAERGEERRAELEMRPTHLRRKERTNEREAFGRSRYGNGARTSANPPAGEATGRAEETGGVRTAKTGEGAVEGGEGAWTARNSLLGRGVGSGEAAAGSGAASEACGRGTEAGEGIVGWRMALDLGF